MWSQLSERQKEDQEVSAKAVERRVLRRLKKVEANHDKLRKMDEANLKCFQPRHK